MYESNPTTYRPAEKITSAAELRNLLATGWDLIELNPATPRGKTAWEIRHRKFKTLPVVWVSGSPVNQLMKKNSLVRLGVIDRWGDGSPAQIAHRMKK